VLHGLIPDAQLGLYLIVNAPGNADAPRIRQGLQAARDVDPVAERYSHLPRSHPEVDPDPEEHPGLFRQFPVPFFDFLLDFHGALHGIHDACELGEKAVPVGRNDTTRCSSIREFMSWKWAFRVLRVFASSSP